MSYCVAQADLEPLGSSNSPVSASGVAGATGVGHWVQLSGCFYVFFVFFSFPAMFQVGFTFVHFAPECFFNLRIHVFHQFR
jgi:hypothetical protein